MGGLSLKMRARIVALLWVLSLMSAQGALGRKLMATIETDDEVVEDDGEGDNDLATNIEEGSEGQIGGDQPVVEEVVPGQGEIEGIVPGNEEVVVEPGVEPVQEVVEPNTEVIEEPGVPGQGGPVVISDPSQQAELEDFLQQQGFPDALFGPDGNFDGFNNPGFGGDINSLLGAPGFGGLPLDIQNLLNSLVGPGFGGLGGLGGN